VLKVLEEPPARTVLMLVSDNPGRLLPTIRSRCRRLVLKKLPLPTSRRRWRAIAPISPPPTRSGWPRWPMAASARADLASSGGLALYQSIFKLLERLPEIDGESLHGFADKLSWGAGEDGFALLGELLPEWIARMVAMAAGGQGRRCPASGGDVPARGPAQP